MATKGTSDGEDQEYVRNVGTRVLTRETRAALLERPNTELYETAIDKSKCFKPWPIEMTIKLRVLIRKWFTELLEHLPEASDEQLRSILLAEHPSATLGDFRSKYVITFMTATNRHMVDDLFAQSVALTRASQSALVRANGDEIAFKAMMGEYMKKNPVYFNVCDFTQMRGVSEVPLEDATAEQVALLAERRATNTRPGAGLLQVDKDTALQEAHAKFQASQRALTAAEAAQAAARAAAPAPKSA